MNHDIKAITLNDYNLLINGKCIDTDDAIVYYVEKSDLKGIQFKEMPSDIEFAVCERVYDEIDTSDFSISKINNIKAKVSFTAGSTRRDYEELDDVNHYLNAVEEIITKNSKPNGIFSKERNEFEDAIILSYWAEVDGVFFDDIIAKAEEINNWVEKEIQNQMSSISALVESLIDTIDSLQRVFEQKYGFNISSQYSLPSIMSIYKPVSDIDSLRLRVTDLSKELIESLNKREFDRDTSVVDSTGSINSLEFFLKKHFPEETQLIEDSIIGPLRAIYNLRNCFSHKKIRNYEKLLTTLGISDSDSPEEKWKKCIQLTRRSFQTILELLMNDQPNQEDSLIVKLAIEKLQTDARKEIVNNIEHNLEAKPYLHILLNEGKLLDTELADMLGHDIKKVRLNLYPLLGMIIHYSYKSKGSTLVEINDMALPLVREVLIKK